MAARVSQAPRMPPYVILHDATIDAISRAASAAGLAELLEVPGIGERKAERFSARGFWS